MEPVTISISNIPIITVTFDLENDNVKFQIHNRPTETDAHFSFSSQNTYDIRYGDLGYPRLSNCGISRYLKYDQEIDCVFSKQYKIYKPDYLSEIKIFSTESGSFEYPFSVKNLSLLDIFIPCKSDTTSGLLLDLTNNVNGNIQIRMILYPYWVARSVGPTLVSKMKFESKDDQQDP